MIERNPLIFRELKEKTFDDLHLLFKNGSVPKFKEIEGDTLGRFLAMNSTLSPLMRFFIKLLFESPIGRWTGKKFITSFDNGNRGNGVNLFANRIMSIRYCFDTYIQKLYFDKKSCLILDYRPYFSLMFGLVDGVRKIEEGIFLGQMRFKIPWQKEFTFIGYFGLCKIS